MQKCLFIYKYKWGPQSWIEWCKVLLSRKEEVLQSLMREWLKMEACFTDEKLWEVYFLIIGKDIRKANQIFLQSIEPIDVEHKVKIQEHLEYFSSPKLLFEFELDE